MNNNWTKHPAQQVSGPNKYLHIAMETKVPLAIHFNDGEIVSQCVITSMDTFNLLVSVLHPDLTPSHEMVVTRSSIKKILFGFQQRSNKQ
jgi:hypothetical protein